ncbi:MAG: hypothetical protein RIS43_911, partial [Actinomycetota bacterium]
MTKRHLLRIGATLALLLSVSGFSPANAEPGYRYWSFWLTTDNAWTAAQEGAGTLIPQDGDLQGWRYISAPATVGPEFAPRSTATFDDICGSTPAEAGKVRVAVVIDFGDASDYTDGTEVPASSASCAVLTEGDPSSLALSSVAEVREDSGMVCAVSNLPATGCGEAFDYVAPIMANARGATADDATTTTPAPEDDRLPQIVGLILGVVVFVMAWRRM